MIGVGTILHDTYRIEAELGRGAMGVVFRASHQRVPREFAVKVLVPSIRDSDTSFARFRREAEISSRLGHPNIIEVFDFNRTDDGQAYFIMELLDGHDLGVEIGEAAPMPLGRVLALLAPVASAVAAAHAAGVVHRDLKPSNIFVAKKGPIEVVKVLDFGVSKIFGAVDLQTQSEALVGTPAYMSPEQAHGHAKHVDARADQFSLAAIAYEMLSGRRAFGGRGETPYMTLYRVVSQEPSPVGEAPPAVREVLARALAKEPAQRFADVSAFFAALERAAGQTPTLAPAPRRRRTRRIAWIGGVAVALAAATVAVELQRRHPRTAVLLPSEPRPATAGASGATAAPVTAAAPSGAEAKAPASPGRLALTIVPPSARVVLVADDGSERVLPGSWAPGGGRIVTWPAGQRPARARVEADGYAPAELKLPADGVAASASITLRRRVVPTKDHGDLSYPWRNR